MPPSTKLLQRAVYPGSAICAKRTMRTSKISTCAGWCGTRRRSPAFWGTAQVKTKEPKDFSLQRVHQVGFVSVQLYAEWRKLLMEPLQSSLSPASFGVVAANADDNVISEPLIAHCLVAPSALFRRVASKVQSNIA